MEWTFWYLTCKPDLQVNACLLFHAFIPIKHYWRATKEALSLFPTDCLFFFCSLLDKGVRDYHHSTAVRNKQAFLDCMSPHSRFKGMCNKCDILYSAQHLAREYWSILVGHATKIISKEGRIFSHKKIRVLVQVWRLPWQLK